MAFGVKYRKISKNREKMKQFSKKPPAISRLADGLPPKGGLINNYLVNYLISPN